MSMEIRLGTDLHELVSLRPDRTMTTWDPQYGWSSDDSFWLHGKCDLQRSCFVIAARLFVAEDFKRDVESGRIFYLNPENRQDAISACIREDACPVGQVVCDGDLYVFPEFRGLGIPAIATRALHREALLRWPEAEWFFGLMEREIAYKGLWQDQGYPHCEGQVIWDHNPYGQRFDMKVVYGSRDEIRRGLCQ